MKDQKLQTLNKARALLIRDFIFACLITLLVWPLLYSMLSPLENMTLPLDRLIFAVKCCGLATLFCLVLGIEAITYERLGTSIITSLGDGDSLRFRINQRYLQQTIEQMLVFIPGLLMLALYCDSGELMRLVEVALIVWMGARFGYWLNYHRNGQTRIPYAIGTLQNVLVLLYSCVRFGYELAGITGAVLVAGFFLALEIYLLGVNKI